ncbi:hypothetical protein JCM10212_002809 [Sporobolomyces blumeae]
MPETSGLARSPRSPPSSRLVSLAPELLGTIFGDLAESMHDPEDATAPICRALLPFTERNQFSILRYFGRPARDSMIGPTPSPRRQELVSHCKKIVLNQKAAGVQPAIDRFRCDFPTFSSTLKSITINDCLLVQFFKTVPLELLTSATHVSLILLEDAFKATTIHVPVHEAAFFESLSHLPIVHLTLDVSNDRPLDYSSILAYVEQKGGDHRSVAKLDLVREPDDPRFHLEFEPDYDVDSTPTPDADLAPRLLSIDYDLDFPNDLYLPQDARQALLDAADANDVDLGAQLADPLRSEARPPYPGDDG